VVAAFCTGPDASRPVAHLVFASANLDITIRARTTSKGYKRHVNALSRNEQGIGMLMPCPEIISHIFLSQYSGLPSIPTIVPLELFNISTSTNLINLQCQSTARVIKVLCLSVTAILELQARRWTMSDTNCLEKLGNKK
jgi:hypothetical protein